ncbi:EamA-like transporter family protein [Acidithrix ferrooxidans]|uniref:EamA-like transporter family protein n=3 Tax=root TaxID=1 RepID=A0A0D8HD77_9ACTN|nr:EamA-like transporter family protein [Acidithrix ferrooxidans]CAG4916653.1 unnamed protein product [Acidithrix sp. C25]
MAAFATLTVGAGITASTYLITIPVFQSQAIRYGVGAIILYFLARPERSKNLKFSAKDKFYLFVVSAFGLVGFSVASLEALKSATAPSVAIIIGAAPVLIAIIGPFIENRRPTIRPIISAGIVLAGTTIIEGASKAGLAGILWAIFALFGDASFSIFSVPLVKKVGPYTLSFWTTSIASISLIIIHFIFEPSKPPNTFTHQEIIALVFQGLFVTVGAFVAWYIGLARIRVELVGLFPGLIPVGALVSALILGQNGGNPLADVIGIALLGVGLYFGAIRSVGQ